MRNKNEERGKRRNEGGTIRKKQENKKNEGKENERIGRLKDRKREKGTGKRK